ncbi:glycosyltransferase family 4 protein [Gulosibacter faecalis]|jgi:glycosyltransferase involved in cell wall biosynthesis|uniref:Glycosyltransferase family 4 protein n=1 Tax=Gulosibacter faecalis TaxID=272240 RepID=A0ABW5UW70_9MICO|nr:glycosyltransferase family 1 protein [Gulosibacter faecalis]
MRFFFDARYIRTDFHDGISRYTAQLGSAVHALAPDEVTFLIHDERQLEHLPAGASWLLFHSNESALEPIAALKLNKYRPDVLFSPLQTIGTAGRKFKAIVSLHDLIYYRHRRPPTNLSPLVRIGWRAYHLTYWPQRAALNGADAVVTVSETSRREILGHRLTKRPVHVIPNAPNDLRERLPDGADPAAGTGRNLVYMGSFMPYKNVETLIHGMAHLPGRALHLLSRIAPKRRAELEALIDATDLAPGAEVVLHGGVSDDEYAALLADDALLVTASLDEGYGLPIAEALALGVPAVVSDLEIFHEVAGDGARYFTAQDPREFATAVQSVSTPQARAQVSDAGIAHIARFTWKASAHRLLEVARSLSNHSPSGH